MHVYCEISITLSEDVLALNLREGPKWYSATVTEILGVNIYNVFVHDLDITWKRHVQQLLPCNKSNMQDYDLNVEQADIPINVKQADIPLNVAPESDVPEDVNIPTVPDADNNVNCPEREDTDSIALRRSIRSKKPVERYVAGSY